MSCRKVLFYNTSSICWVREQNIVHNYRQSMEPQLSLSTQQKLEEACSRAEGSTAISTLHHDEPYGGSSYVPTRIREIADQCLSPSRQRICPSQNNSALQNELRKAQDMLDQSRQDCKSLSTKYLAVSDKVSSALRPEALLSCSVSNLPIMKNSSN